MLKRLLIGLSACAAMLATPVVLELPVWARVQQFSQAIAQNLQSEENPIVMQLAVEQKVIELDAQGETVSRWQSLEGDQIQVQPGDTLRYWLDIQNLSDRPVSDLAIVQPVPDNTVYILETATADDNTVITFSIDGGNQFVAAPTISVTLADGSVVTQPAPAEAYTHIRWQFAQANPSTSLVANYQVEVR
ncbi:MAG: hypothetical protein ACTS3T_14910 [Almyronema sp.]